MARARAFCQTDSVASCSAALQEIFHRDALCGAVQDVGKNAVDERCNNLHRRAACGVEARSAQTLIVGI
jgi:hypothetical protein